MQFTVNLLAGQLRRMETRGQQFLIISATVSTAIAVALKLNGQELESIRTAGRGFRARVPAPGFDVVELTATADTSIEVVVTDSAVDFDFVSGAEVTATITGLPLPVQNDRGTPGNLLFVSGVSVADAPATAAANAGPVACSNVAAVIAAADATRRELRVLNLGPDPVAIGPAGLTWAGRAVVLDVGDLWIETRGANLAWSAITDVGKAASVNTQRVVA